MKGSPAASTALPRPPLAAIALLSCTALAYEILLTRLFSMVHWHHLATLVISLALLGYGASGSFLTLARRHLMPRFELAFLFNAMLFTVTIVCAFRLARQQAFNPLELAWNPWQLWNLTKIYLLLALPFFAVANCIGLSLWRYPVLITRIYAADLAGAGSGAVLIVGLLYLQPPSEVLLTVSITAALASGLTTLSFAGHKRLAGLAVLPLALGLALSPPSWREARPSDYKDLAHALSGRGASIVRHASNPLGVITVVDNREAPYRHAPGLSIATPVTVPPVPALFLNGDLVGGLYRHDTPVEHLGHLISALPFALLDSPRVLINGAGGGMATAQAFSQGAIHIDLVEPNPLLLDLLREGFAGSGNSRIDFLNTTLRRHLAGTQGRYDLIQWSTADGMGDPIGLQAPRENHGYTREAFEDALDHLSPQGMIAITRGLKSPPKGGLRLAALAIVALEAKGRAHPGRQLAMIRGWNSATLLVFAQPIDELQRSRIRAFCQTRAFDLAWLPGIQPEQLNRHHVLPSPMLHEGMLALLSPQRTRFIQAYPFRITPPDDDAPYVDHHTRAGRIGEFLRQPAGTGLGYLDWGYALLWIALLLALLFSLLLILLPLAITEWARAAPTPRHGRWPLLFFGVIGLAFLFVEIAFIQHLQLFLGDPIYAMTVVLGAFLVSAGMGSRWSGLLALGWGQRTTLGMALGVIIVFAGLQLSVSPLLFDQAAQLGLGGRTLLCLLLLVPMGVAMGMPFPLGLSRVGETNPELIPWAWGINGCASVISAIGASLLAMEIGFSGVLMLASGLYLAAFALFPGGKDS